ncbi:MAG TPA: DUF58 domain-containing protein, partial [Dermatophilaceae bacterium]|nr:DUF58 domain-containing protein [Dermatophilaceae bacterium]
MSGRFALLILAGAVPVLIEPTRRTVLLWVLLCLALAVVDALLAASPRKLIVTREPLGAIRLGERAQSTLLVTNPTRRTLRGQLRDAWQPSAGAADDRHPVRIPAGERRRFVTTLRPTRRGDRPADRVTVRAFGPMRLGARQRSLEVAGSIRALPPFE